MFFPGSRYLPVGTYSVTRADGFVVTVTKTPTRGPRLVLGFYRRNDGDRLDQIAGRFLADATRFWHVCDANGAVIPDALAARPLVGVPIDATGAG